MKSYAEIVQPLYEQWTFAFTEIVTMSSFIRDIGPRVSYVRKLLVRMSCLDYLPGPFALDDLICIFTMLARATDMEVLIFGDHRRGRRGDLPMTLRLFHAHFSRIAPILTSFGRKRGKDAYAVIDVLCFRFYSSNDVVRML